MSNKYYLLTYLLTSVPITVMHMCKSGEMGPIYGRKYFLTYECLNLKHNRAQLFIPRHNLSFGSRAFRFSAPRIWNKLPLRIRETQSLPAFKRHLKTHFFLSAYPTP